MATFNPVGGQTYTLSGSISSTATSITLTSFTEPVSGTVYTMSNMNTDIAYGTISPKTTSSEFISFTGITANADGTATLTGVTRGLAKKYPFTTSATYKLPHSGQSQFILSDMPQVFQKYVSVENAETIAGVKTFSSFPVTPSSAPTTDYQVANKKYVDDTAIAGAPDATLTVKGIVEIATTAEIDAGTATGGTGASIVARPDQMAASIYATRLPTAGEKSALVGDNTDIAVGSGNKYVTQTGLQKQAECYAADSQASDTYVITLSPVPTSLVNGMTLRFKANTANTGPATLNVNSLGALSIVTGLSTALATGDIVANQVCEVVYNSTGTVWQLINPASAVITSQTVTYTNGITTKNLADASGTQTIAHGLGKTPKKIAITFMFSSGTTFQGVATLAYNGTTKSVVGYMVSNSALRDASGTDIILYEAADNTEFQTGVVTFDATNISIAWTKTNSPTGVWGMMWEAEAQ